MFGGFEKYKKKIFSVLLNKNHNVLSVISWVHFDRVISNVFFKMKHFYEFYWICKISIKLDKGVTIESEHNF